MPAPHREPPTHRVTTLPELSSRTPQPRLTVLPRGPRRIKSQLHRCPCAVLQGHHWRSWGGILAGAAEQLVVAAQPLLALAMPKSTNDSWVVVRDQANSLIIENHLNAERS